MPTSHRPPRPGRSRLVGVTLLTVLTIAGACGPPAPAPATPTPTGPSAPPGQAAGTPGRPCQSAPATATPPSGQAIRRFGEHQAAVTDVAFAPGGGGRLASVGDDGAARVWSLDGATTAVHPAGQYPTAVAWSPNGACLASASSTGDIVIWLATGGDDLVHLAGPHDRVYGLAWSPDGRSIAAGSWDGTGVIWDAATGTARQTFRSPGGVGHVVWSADSTRVALVTATGDLVMLRANDGTVVRRTRLTNAPLWSVAWSPDGATLAAGVGEYGAAFGAAYAVYIVDAATGQIRRTVRPTHGPVWALAWSPDGRQLAAAGGTFAGLHPPAALADYRVVVFRPTDGTPLWVDGQHTDSVWGLSWSTDGELLASASQDGSVVLTAKS